MTDKDLKSDGLNGNKIQFFKLADSIHLQMNQWHPFLHVSRIKDNPQELMCHLKRISFHKWRLNTERQLDGRNTICLLEASIDMMMGETGVAWTHDTHMVRW